MFSERQSPPCERCSVWGTGRHGGTAYEKVRYMRSGHERPKPTLCKGPDWVLFIKGVRRMSMYR